ncbi:MAG: aminotransferase class V-fold PLP-dependent enzyme [Gemmatimonadota bacterium]|nr:MAG: aminotransferase class V-fold PLP-dependent enzyme [Gemmatimonadota bacterium]
MDRRNFVAYLAGATAMSTKSLITLNSDIYGSIEQLNQSLQQGSPDGAYWEALRKHFIMQEDLIMMNNGTLGPMPEPVFNTVVQYFKVQATNPYDCYNFLPRKKNEIRTRLANFINADPDEVAINRNTTEGMSAVATGMDFQPGDEVIISSQEHPAGYHPWKLQEKRHGIKIVEVPVGVPPKNKSEIIDAFAGAITPRTRVISVSHTVYITGLIFPIKELSEIAHEQGIFVLADSAHGIGMLDLDMHDLGVDAFASSPYKWCGAPAGCGLFYVRRESQDRLWPAVASSGWDTVQSAARFETLGQRADPLTFGLGEALDFQNRIGRGRIQRRIQTLAKHLKDGLKGIPGVRLHTSHDPLLSAGLVAFSVEGVEPNDLVNYLREKYNIVIRTIGRDRDNTRGVRVSTHIFVTMEHVDLLLEGVDYMARRV